MIRCGQRNIYSGYCMGGVKSWLERVSARPQKIKIKLQV